MRRAAAPQGTVPMSVSGRLQNFRGLSVTMRGLEHSAGKFPSSPAPQRGSGRDMPRISKVWNFSGENFQGLELFGEKLPRFGTFLEKTSKVWNFLDCKLPKIGTFQRRTSKAARPSAGVGAGLELSSGGLPGPLRSLPGWVGDSCRKQLPRPGTLSP